jgi:hypothetical protein
MKNTILAFVLALLVVLSSVSIRRSVLGIGTAPMPLPPPPVVGIGTPPMPLPPPPAVGIGTAPMPLPPPPVF